MYVKNFVHLKSALETSYLSMLNHVLWDVNPARECVDSGILGAGPDCTTNQLIIVRLQFSKL